MFSPFVPILNCIVKEPSSLFPIQSPASMLMPSFPAVTMLLEQPIREINALKTNSRQEVYVQYFLVVQIFVHVRILFARYAWQTT